MSDVEDVEKDENIERRGLLPFRTESKRSGPSPQLEDQVSRQNIVSIALSDTELKVLRTIPGANDSEKIRVLIRTLITGEWSPEPPKNDKK